MCGLNHREAYRHTLVEHLGHVASFSPADQVARRPNFLDIIDDSWLNETEHPLWDLFWFRRQKNVALHSRKTGRFIHSSLVGFANCAGPLWSAYKGPLLTSQGAPLQLPWQPS